MTSPAERFAAARARSQRSDLSNFESSLSFPLDRFQREACEAVADGHSVLVAAPTGAGKTLVGEFAVRHAFERGEKAFYTTPIKALSNQKFNDLRRTYGTENVGLLTGDTSINAHAPIVVMTTEVLRNMIYAGSRDLDNLGAVVLDEVHYLADRFRGSVWEEVIIHLGQRTALICLSATVSNAEEFGAWLTEVRGTPRSSCPSIGPFPCGPTCSCARGSLICTRLASTLRTLAPTPASTPSLRRSRAARVRGGLRGPRSQAHQGRTQAGGAPCASAVRGR
ncbi:DEAD/DEAH box helicase [Demequina litorisediminis]|uniref:Helicase ATP-binding domain-containing protein n=1 Tax=Demequina litorisediminis TaxID=1849022 RepID=A0ABQ6IKG0_9MICO|nr:hypothetical protein GCM10025876_38370 [Demequina litorisediminis]